MLRIHRDIRIFLAHFLQLTFLKGISRILPLATLPFLLRTIGVEKCGILEFVKSFSFYFTTFISYSFRYSATEQISQYKHDKLTIGQILGAVYAIKLVAIVASLAVLALLLYLVPSIRLAKSYCLCFFSIAVVSSLFPIYVFQGLEKIKWATILNLLAKLLYLAGIFILVREPSDAILIPILLLIVDTLRLVVGLYLVYRILGIAVYQPTWGMIYRQLQVGWHIFLSQLSVIFYTPLPIIFLGSFVSPTSVAIYSLGDRIIRTTISMIEPFVQALFPLASTRVAQRLQTGFQFVGKIMLVSVGALLMISTSYWLWAASIIQLFAGKPMPEATYVLRLHAFLPCIIAISTLLGLAFLVPAGAGNQYTTIVFMTGLICVGLHGMYWMWGVQLQAQGVAWIILICEIFSAVMMTLEALRIYRRRGRRLASSPNK
ncbi:MAG: oligosaccharide flippase family protein [Bacteroidota bacterium]